MTGNKIAEIPQHVKDLRIYKEENRAELEEFWQDKEKNPFTIKDADRVLMQWGSDPKKSQDIFNEENNLMFSGALQAYYYHKGNDTHAILLHGEAIKGKKLDADSDADDEEEHVHEEDVLAWHPPKKGEKRSLTVCF